MDLKLAIPEGLVVLIVWLLIFGFSAIAKKFKGKGNERKPFDEVEWEGEEFKPAQPSQPAKPRVPITPKPAPRPVMEDPVEERPATLASRLETKDRQDAARHSAPHELAGARPTSQATPMPGTQGLDPQPLPNPADMSIEQMREVVLAAARRQKGLMAQPAPAKLAPAAPAAGFSAAISGPPSKAKERPAWEKPRINLRDPRRLRDALIAREVLERPRAFDI